YAPRLLEPIRLCLSCRRNGRLRCIGRMRNEQFPYPTILREAAPVVRFTRGLVAVPAHIELQNEGAQRLIQRGQLPASQQTKVVSVGPGAIKLDDAGLVELEQNRQEDGPKGTPEVVVSCETLRLSEPDIRFG